jgi:hypothetical protein
MDLLALTKLAVDAALVVLALLVQRIIYPSFEKIFSDHFLSWHETYTSEIGRIVAPLMLAQLALSSYMLWHNSFSSLSVLIFVLVLLTWIDTFARAMPLHAQLQQIKSTKEQQTIARKLVKVNFPRTLIWIAIFALQLYSLVT